jgi:hypothetical protein
MFDTVNTQSTHYTDGCFRAGSGERVVVIHGSCRIMPYVNYLNRLNSDNRFTLCVINIVNFAFDRHGNSVNTDAFTQQFEGNPVLLDMMKRCRWFIHEHAENFGCFNTSKAASKNLFQLGLQPELEVCIPNFNDRFILERDYASCGMPTPDDYIERGEEAVKKFCKVCELSSFPEMSDHFRDNWRATRFFWSPNHISSSFSMYLLKQMDERFLKLGLSDGFLLAASREDLFKEPHTEVTRRDVEGYGLSWPV